MINWIKESAKVTAKQTYKHLKENNFQLDEVTGSTAGRYTNADASGSLPKAKEKNFFSRLSDKVQKVRQNVVGLNRAEKKTTGVVDQKASVKADATDTKKTLPPADIINTAHAARSQEAKRSRENPRAVENPRNNIIARAVQNHANASGKEDNKHDYNNLEPRNPPAANINQKHARERIKSNQETRNAIKAASPARPDTDTNISSQRYQQNDPISSVVSSGAGSNRTSQPAPTPSAVTKADDPKNYSGMGTSDKPGGADKVKSVNDPATVLRPNAAAAPKPAAKPAAGPGPGAQAIGANQAHGYGQDKSIASDMARRVNNQSGFSGYGKDKSGSRNTTQHDHGTNMYESNGFENFLRKRNVSKKSD